MKTLTHSSDSGSRAAPLIEDTIGRYFEMIAKDYPNTKRWCHGIKSCA